MGAVRLLVLVVAVVAVVAAAVEALLEEVDALTVTMRVAPQPTAATKITAINTVRVKRIHLGVERPSLTGSPFRTQTPVYDGTRQSSQGLGSNPRCRQRSCLSGTFADRTASVRYVYMRAYPERELRLDSVHSRAHMEATQLLDRHFAGANLRELADLDGVKSLTIASVVGPPPRLRALWRRSVAWVRTGEFARSRWDRRPQRPRDRGLPGSGRLPDHRRHDQFIAVAGTPSSRPMARGARSFSKITAPPGQYGCGGAALWTSSGS